MTFQSLSRSSLLVVLLASPMAKSAPSVVEDYAKDAAQAFGKAFYRSLAAASLAWGAGKVAEAVNVSKLSHGWVTKEDVQNTVGIAAFQHGVRMPKQPLKLVETVATAGAAQKIASSEAGKALLLLLPKGEWLAGNPRLATLATWLALHYGFVPEVKKQIKSERSNGSSPSEVRSASVGSASGNNN